MKILVLGAKGMLGQELVRAFLSDEVIALDREDCDITQKAAVERKLEELQPDYIINAAAYNDVDRAEKEQTELAENINGAAVKNLAHMAHVLDVPFIHYSSDYVFDGTKETGYTEEDTPHPISAYGRSKLLGERNLITYDLLPITYYLIRTSRLFGKEGGGKKSFVDTMLEYGRSKTVMEIVDEEYASPTYAVDLAQRTHDIVKQKKEFGIYHMTNSGACTWYVFAQEIFKQAQELRLIERAPQLIPVSADRFPRSAARPKHSQLLNTKLPPMRPWQEALQEYLQTK